MRRTVSALVLMLSIAVLAGCVGPKPAPPGDYIAGKVVEYGSNWGLADVELSFSSGGVVTTSTTGTWRMDDAKGTVTIIPSKAGWSFLPARMTAKPGDTNLVFQAARTNQIHDFAEIGPVAEEVMELIALMFYGNDAERAQAQTTFRSLLSNPTMLMGQAYAPNTFFESLIIRVAAGQLYPSETFQIKSVASFGNVARADVLTAYDVWLFTFKRDNSNSTWKISALDYQRR